MNSPNLGPMHAGSNDSIGPYLVAASGFYFAHGVRPLVLKSFCRLSLQRTFAEPLTHGVLDPSTFDIGPLRNEWLCHGLQGLDDFDLYIPPGVRPLGQFLVNFWYNNNNGANIDAYLVAGISGNSPNLHPGEFHLLKWMPHPRRGAELSLWESSVSVVHGPHLNFRNFQK